MDLFLALLFTFLLLLFLGFCFGRALLPVYGAWIVVSAEGKGEELEQKLYALLWLQGLGLLRCPICILDEGLDEEGLKLANQLVKRLPEVTLWESWGVPK